MASVFTRIVRGELPCYKVAETESCLAFLDINPLAKGHTLVIPKAEIDYLFDIDDPLYSELFSFSKKVARAIQAVIPCARIGMAVIGLEVPHAHIHLCPINGIHDLSFSNPRVKLSREEFQQIADAISATYLDLG
ncbi:MAG: HIT family protein [Chitinophagales bacterium]|nr:MAG: HIT family protein [Chitinophagales bacterium]